MTGDEPALSVFHTNFWGAREGYEHVTTWRPLTTLGFRWTWAVAPDQPAAFHLVNLLLHALVTALVYGLVWLWFGRAAPATFAALLFAVLPVHVEAVAGAVNRAELQAAAFFLAALIMALREGRGYWWALLFFAAGLLSKEHVMLWPFALGALVLYRVLRHKREPHYHPTPTGPPVAWYVILAVGIGLYLWARALVLPSLLGGDIPAQDNPLVLEGWWARICTAAKVYAVYLRLLIAPFYLSADYSAHAIPVAFSFEDPEALLGLLCLLASVGALALAVRRHLEVASCLLLFAVLYGLISNLVILNTILMADRLMYLPSVAYCALIGLMTATVWEAQGSTLRRALVGLSFAVIAGGYGFRSLDRTADWKDAETLFSSSLEGYPDSARARYNLGFALYERGDFDGAETQLLAADLLVSDDVHTLSLLGDLTFGKSEAPRALEYYERAFRARPMPETAANLCKVLAMSPRFEEAITICARVAEERPDYASVRTFLGHAYRRAGRYDEARAVLNEALILEPDNPFIQRELDSVP